MKDYELSKDDYTKVKSIIYEMVMKALPKGLRTEAIQKRYSDPEAVMLMIMIKYQPGSRKEKEALLQQIQSPPQSEKKDDVLNNLKLWKRRIERANELKISIPDPSILLKALDKITATVIKEDPRRSFRIESAREEIGIDTTTTIEAVNKIALLIE